MATKRLLVTALILLGLGHVVWPLVAARTDIQNLERNWIQSGRERKAISFSSRDEMAIYCGTLVAIADGLQCASWVSLKLPIQNGQYPKIRARNAHSTRNATRMFFLIALRKADYTPCNAFLNHAAQYRSRGIPHPMSHTACALGHDVSSGKQGIQQSLKFPDHAESHSFASRRARDMSWPASVWHSCHKMRFHAWVWPTLFDIELTYIQRGLATLCITT